MDHKVVKKCKKKVNFNDVTIFYFGREQGFTAVPHEGGSTLGMSFEHIATEKISLDDHTNYRKQSFLKTTPKSSPGKSTDTIVRAESSGGAGYNELENEDWYFSTKRLKPENRLTPAQRRLLLRESGVMKIDRSEGEECKEIRDSRRKTGCDCRQGCLPDKCSCAKYGIQCFNEDENYPCSCTKKNCSNPNGHLEYSSDSIYNHYARTMARLKREGY